jgi:glycosyltransferase involved in cell wall biosynthesis
MSEEVKEGESGLLVDFGDVNGISRALKMILQDEHLAKKMGTNGRRIVEDQFTWKAVAHRVDSIYRELRMV